MWAFLKRPKMHMGVKLTSCHGCNCVIEVGKTKKVEIVSDIYSPYNRDSSSIEHFCNKCSPPYDRVVDGYREFSKDPTEDSIYIPDKYYRKVYVDPWQRVNEDGSNYEEEEK